ncbi:MAG: hypothetical protein WBG92_01155, partial [Thiohalocapsa sp.]
AQHRRLGSPLLGQVALRRARRAALNVIIRLSEYSGGLMRLPWRCYEGVVLSRVAPLVFG